LVKNILLIGPTSDREMVEVKWLAPPLGVIRLAGYLNNQGHYTEWLDLNLAHAQGKERCLEEKLQEKNWDLVGFSVLEDSLVNDIGNMYTANRLQPRATLVAGGMQAQFDYQTILDKSPCKIVILGEGEEPLLKIANGVQLQDISGIVYRNDAKPLTKADFSATTHGIPWENIPFEAYWDYYLDKYRGKLTESRLDQIHTLRVFTRNRCPRRCTFCSSTNQLPGASGVSSPVIDIMADEDFTELLTRIKAAHPRLRTVYFTDDDFCLNPHKVIDFCQQSTRKELGLKYIGFARVNELQTEMLEWMSKAGFRTLNIGVESFSQKVLDELDKGYSCGLTELNLRSAKKYGINPFISVILISPQSTLEDVELTVQKTSALIEERLVDASIALACIPFKGSKIYETTFDYLTTIVPIPGTSHLVKRERMILADDPYVREVQLRFYNTIETHLDQSKEGLVSMTSADQALVRLKHMQQIITQVRQEYKLETGIADKSMGKLTATYASKCIGDRHQGV
jgi:radical SAM superfamily enzyme YgiQ (UPF0313 family)